MIVTRAHHTKFLAINLTVVAFIFKKQKSRQAKKRKRMENCFMLHGTMTLTFKVPRMVVKTDRTKWLVALVMNAKKTSRNVGFPKQTLQR